MGGLMISIDVPLIRLALSDPWLVMSFRGFGLASVLGCVLLFGRRWTDTPANPFDDREWVVVGILYGITSIMFTIAVFHTSTANLVFILAFNPMIAAIMAWVLIGEKPGMVTWIALFFTFVGVAIIVGDGLEGGTLLGDLAALGCAVVLGLSIVLVRKSGKDMSLSPAMGGLFSSLFALPLAFVYSSWPEGMGWLLADAFLLMPVAGFCMSLAPRFIPAPQVAMFFLAETVLAPIWVWLIFAEIPTDRALLGGLVVMLAIAGHSAWQMTRPKAAALA